MILAMPLLRTPLCEGSTHTAGLFAHFGSKEALQLAVLEHTRGRFAAHLEPRMRGVAKGVPTLKAFMHAWLDWVASSDLPAGCPILGATFELEVRDGPARDFLVKLHGRAGYFLIRKDIK